jgi:predicted HAD superfamily Cof-like phosphohydrolase
MHVAIHRGLAVVSQTQRGVGGLWRQLMKMLNHPNVPLGQDGAIDIAAAVAEFHEAFGLPVREVPSSEVGCDLAKLRVALLEEEVSEFVTASGKGDLVGIADALADITYVVYGTALTYGIDLDAVLREVHRSNMSKLDSDGRPLIRDDGKVLKSGRYFPPDIEAVLSRQSARPAEVIH